MHLHHTDLLYSHISMWFNIHIVLNYACTQTHTNLRTDVWQFNVLPYMRQSRDIMTFVSASHIILLCKKTKIIFERSQRKKKICIFWKIQQKWQVCVWWLSDLKTSALRHSNLLHWVGVVSPHVFFQFDTFNKGMNYSGAKFFYTQPLSLNKTHSKKWEAFDNKTLRLYNHSLQ